MTGSDEIKNDPDQGTEIEYAPQVSDDPRQRDFPNTARHHIFPANIGAFSWHKGPQPQLGSVLEIVKKD